MMKCLIIHQTVDSTTLQASTSLRQVHSVIKLWCSYRFPNMASIDQLVMYYNHGVTLSYDVQSI